MNKSLTNVNRDIDSSILPWRSQSQFSHDWWQTLIPSIRFLLPYFSSDCVWFWVMNSEVGIETINWKIILSDLTHNQNGINTENEAHEACCYLWRKIICTPESVHTGSRESWPGCIAMTAFSKAGCIAPSLNGANSPPFAALLQSL